MMINGRIGMHRKYGKKLRDTKRGIKEAIFIKKDMSRTTMALVERSKVMYPLV